MSATTPLSLMAVPPSNQWMAEGVRVRLAPRAILVAFVTYAVNVLIERLVVRSPHMFDELTDLFGMGVCLVAYMVAIRGRHAAASRLIVWGVSLESLLDYWFSPFAVSQTTVFMPVIVVGAGLVRGLGTAARVYAVLGAAMLAFAIVRPDKPPTGDQWSILVAIECAGAAALAFVWAAATVFRAVLMRERAAADQARALVERAPDGIIVLDALGRIREVNAAARALLAPATVEVGAPLAPAVRGYDGEAVDVVHLRTAPQQLLRLRTTDGGRSLAVTGARLDGGPEDPALLLMLRVIPTPVRSVAAPAGGEALHVMVVDDDATIREVLARLLRKDGHLPIVHATAETALDALASGRERADVVFSDVMMPGMHGADFARALRMRDPGMPLVLMSGDPHGLLDGLSLAGGPWVYLAKPFPRDAVKDAIARARRAARVGLPPRS